MKLLSVRGTVPDSSRGYVELLCEEGDIKVNCAHCCQCAGVSCLLQTKSSEHDVSGKLIWILCLLDRASS